jgi:hypothetical protein
MKKIKIIILTFVSILISLIYILLNYFGILRYINIYMLSTERYLNTYTKLDLADTKNKVVISIVTTPNNLTNLKPVISSLLDQTVKVNLISVTIPYGKNNLPDNIKNYVSLHRTGRDFKDGNSIIPVISREKNSNTIIIVLGDNFIYGKDFIESLLEESSKNPNNIINVNSSDINFRKGVLFKINFFDESFIDIPLIIDPNIWVNNYFKNKNVKLTEFKYNDNWKTL